MKMQTRSFERLYKAFIYVALITLAISIIVPVGWVFVASIKQNSEFYGSPWTAPKGFYFQNFIDAWTSAKMGDYMLNSVIVTALALIILVAVAIPAAYVLARFKFPGSKLINTLLKGGLFINVNYIVVPIFLMLLDWDKGLKSFGIANGFFLNNIFVLAVVYAATSLPFTIYLLSNFFKTLPTTFEEAAAIDQAVANAEIVELPSEMVHEEVHRAVNEFLGNMQRQGISPDMYFQITGTTQEDLHKQYEADAESRTKTNLVVEAVAKAEGFEASAEEIEAEVTSLATDYNMEVERVRQLLSEDMLKHDIAIKKAVEVITSTAKVK